jgi:hypothetical protein
MACANRVSIGFKKGLFLVAVSLSFLGGLLSPPVLILRKWNPAYFFLCLIVFFLAYVVKRETHPRRVFQGALLLGFLFGLGQSFGLYLFNSPSAIFTGFFLLDRFWMIQAYILIAGFLALTAHGFFQRKYWRGLLYFLFSLILELLTAQYFLVKKVLPFLPSRPYLLPFSIILGYFGVSLLYHFYALKMQKIINKEGDENESVQA